MMVWQSGDQPAAAEPCRRGASDQRRHVGRERAGDRTGDEDADGGEQHARAGRGCR